MKTGHCKCLSETLLCSFIHIMFVVATNKTQYPYKSFIFAQGAMKGLCT